MMEVMLCPVCSKKPKIKRERNVSGAWCVIQCKPFLRKPHIRIECGKASPERAYTEAVIAWNTAVSEIEDIL